MDAKMKSTLATVGGLLAIPLAGLVLYGAYFIFTYKPKPKPPEPKIVTFRADGKPKESPDDKKGGKKKVDKSVPVVWDVELVWETENADEVTIDNGIGKVEAKGSKHVEIDKDTTFVMKAKNAAGEITYSLDVGITPPEQQ